MRNLMIAVLLCIAVLVQCCGGDAPDFRNSRWGDSREAVMQSETTRQILDEDLHYMIGYVGKHSSVNDSESLVFQTTLKSILSFSVAEKTPEQISEELFPKSPDTEISVKIVYNFNDAGHLDSAYLGRELFGSPFTILNEIHVRKLTRHAVQLHGKPITISVDTEVREGTKPYVVTITTLTWQTKSRHITLCFEKRRENFNFLWSYEAR